MPDAKIIVHDSCSEDQSYREHKIMEGVEIIPGNAGYETSAIWRTYNLYPNEDYYFFIHDSISILKSWEGFTNQPLTTLASFPSDFWFEEDEREWSKKELLKSDYNFTMDFYGVFGSVFGCEPYVLAKLKRHGFNNIVPSDKLGSRAMERVWGMAFAQIGLGELVRQNSIFGQVIDITALRNEYFEKHIARRQ